MIELLTAFLLYQFDAEWGWWVAYGVLFALTAIGRLTK
jgi:hypothetical protein